MFNRTLPAVALALFASLAAAQTGEDVEALRQRVRELERRVEQLQSQTSSPEVEELRRQIEILTREIEALRLQRQPPPAADQTQFGLGQAASKVYRVESGISFGGYGEMLYENFDTTREDRAPSGRKDQVDFLRAILYAGYKFTENVIFNSEIEFEHGSTGLGGEVSVEFAYLDFLIRPEVNARAGLLLVPMGLVNELHEPTAFIGARRPQVEQTILPTTWRETGAGVFGDVGPVSYRAYVITGLRSERFTSAGIRPGRQQGARAQAEDFALVVRGDWNITQGLSAGAAVYSGGSSQDRRTPAGEGFDANVTIVDLHADVQMRGWLLRGVWASTEVDDAAQINLANNLTGDRSVGEEQGGWYVDLGYDLAALFSIGDDSVIPYVRYEAFDTQREVPAGFRRSPATDVEITTIGIAWKPIPQAVIKIDHQDFANEGRTGIDQINAAIGYIF